MKKARWYLDRAIEKEEKAADWRQTDKA
jgi:hypothetical protein